MTPLRVMAHPRQAFDELAAAPQLQHGFLAVMSSGFASLVIAAAATLLDRGGTAGYVVALSLPPLYAVYWMVEGALVDAAAGMLGRSGRRRDFLAVSGWAFTAWIAYAVLGLAEAAALRSGGGAGAALASALQWCTLPVLAWFVALTVLAVRAVYRVSALNAFAFALLPYAALTAAILVLGLVLGALHSAGLV